MTTSSTQTITPDLPASQKRPTNPAAEAWESFKKNSAGHQLTVLHEQGLYRHIRMAKPASRAESWYIVTWPGHDRPTDHRLDDAHPHRYVPHRPRASEGDASPPRAVDLEKRVE